MIFCTLLFWNCVCLLTLHLKNNRVVKYFSEKGFSLKRIMRFKKQVIFWLQRLISQLQEVQVQLGGNVTLLCNFSLLKVYLLCVLEPWSYLRIEIEFLYLPSPKRFYKSLVSHREVNFIFSLLNTGSFQICKTQLRTLPFE